MDTYLSGWWSMTTSYLSDAAALFGGEVSALTVVSAAGLFLLIVGILTAVVQRVSRAQRLIVPAILTLLSPILILFIDNTLHWLGRVLITMLCVGALLIWIGLIVGNAPKKLPIWLIGLGLVSFVAYFGLVTLLPLLLN